MLESPLKATFHGMFRPLENVTRKLREALLCNPKMEVWICVKLLPNWIRNSTTSGRWEKRSPVGNDTSKAKENRKKHGKLHVVSIFSS